MENEQKILNFEDNIDDVKALFEAAKRDKHEVTTDRAELLDNYDLGMITGSKVIAGPIDVVKYNGKQVNLLNYLEDLLQGKVEKFLSKVLNIKTTNYQRYVKVHAEHALNVLSASSKQSKEMKKAFRNIKGLKQVMTAIWIEALVNPMQYKPTKDTYYGVVQILAINRIYNRLAPRTKNCLSEQKLTNIINLLIVAGQLERLPFDSLNDNQQTLLTRHYQDLYKCPTFYLCFNDPECAYWQRISNLSEKTMLTPDAVREVYGDKIADRMLPITGQPNHKRLELTANQINKITKLLTTQDVTTYDELVALLPDFGVMNKVGVAIDGDNLKRHLNSFEALGYFEALGIEVMTAARARSKGYTVPDSLSGRSKVYVRAV
ncbi:hypothetical protein [Lactiplantibacillus plantarum]|uniref:hypothetical protein n=1 Tax=Lactiplantibacillus plantarum TaxID=1590 RepID=UPI000BE3DF6F|nr:hypothetical protein [Lactiplantibacillus plantarum]